VNPFCLAVRCLDMLARNVLPCFSGPRRSLETLCVGRAKPEILTDSPRDVCNRPTPA
jgi:hypothetical protein